VLHHGWLARFLNRVHQSSRDQRTALCEPLGLRLSKEVQHFPPWFFERSCYQAVDEGLDRGLLGGRVGGDARVSSYPRTIRGSGDRQPPHSPNVHRVVARAFATSRAATVRQRVLAGGGFACHFADVPIVLYGVQRFLVGSEGRRSEVADLTLSFVTRVLSPEPGRRDTSTEDAVATPPLVDDAARDRAVVPVDHCPPSRRIAGTRD